jgi:hypothetical protein
VKGRFGNEFFNRLGLAQSVTTNISTRTAVERVATADLVLAAVLLVGVLIVSYGYFYSSMTAFYAGLFTIIGGVIFGAIRIVTR